MVAQLNHRDIATPRLVLRLLSQKGVAACLSGDARTASDELAATVPADLLGERSGLRYSLAELRRDPAYQPWSTRAVVLRATMSVIGHVRFHERPDPATPHPLGGHAAELGYTVFAPHRRAGYAAEAVTALMEWARSEHAVTRFVASVSPTNVASLRLVDRLGFTQVGEQVDEIDGSEWVFLRVLE